MCNENSQVTALNHTASELLKQILPVPSQQLLTNRFMTAGATGAACKPGCSGQCEGFVG